MKQKTLLMSLFSMFSDTNVGIKKPSCGWKDDDQRLAKADKKMLRKNAIRLRNKQRV